MLSKGEWLLSKGKTRGALRKSWSEDDTEVMTIIPSLRHLKSERWYPNYIQQDKRPSEYFKVVTNRSSQASKKFKGVVLQQIPRTGKGLSLRDLWIWFPFKVLDPNKIHRKPIHFLKELYQLNYASLE